MICVFRDSGLVPPADIQRYKNAVWGLYRDTKNDQDPWANRQICITNDPVVGEVKKFLEGRLKVGLTCSQAQVQIWPEGSDSPLHIHDDFGRQRTEFNSLLYLNEDFTGGEFFTECGLFVAPKVNTLTFFDGSKVRHGVKKVTSGHRFTLIFWWGATNF